MPLTPREIESKLRDLRLGVTSTGNCIRRYSLDGRLCVPVDPRTPEEQRCARVEQRLTAAWTTWLTVRERVNALPAAPPETDLSAAATQWLELDHEVDGVQRELISEGSTWWGVATVIGLILALLVGVLAYLAAHGVHGLDVSNFEPWPEWGPAKYFEVAYWSFFGVLCRLLFTATYYVARRDFDQNYVVWYASTALRAPLLVVILMLMVLEFVEWYADGTWLANYLLEEGNKFYFIIFMSFCLGISSETSAAIIGDLSAGVSTLVQRAVTRVAGRLGAVVSDADVLRR
jgi:hypothetical protein